MDTLSNEDENETLPANLGPMRGAANDDGAAQVSDVLLDKGKETTGKRTELEERRGARMSWPARTEKSLFKKERLQKPQTKLSIARK